MITGTKLNIYKCAYCNNKYKRFTSKWLEKHFMKCHPDNNIGVVRIL